MSYTEWIRKNFPSMQEADSAEIGRLIRQAREQSRVWRALLLLPTMALVLMFGRLGGALFGGELFGTGMKSWLLSVIAVVAAFAIKVVLDHFIIKSRIRLAIQQHHRVSGNGTGTAEAESRAGRQR